MLTISSLRRGAVTATLTLALCTLLQFSHDAQGQNPEEASMSIASTFRDDADAALTEWATGRFERAGLLLPPFSIAFHDDKAHCEGHYGFYRPTKPAHIDICGFNGNRFLITPRRTVLHELAHAWTHQHLSEDSIQAFLRFRGLGAWNNPSASWEARGVEHAAEIIAWGLLEDDAGLFSIPDAKREVLAVAFEMLTSMPPPSR